MKGLPRGRLAIFLAFVVAMLIYLVVSFGRAGHSRPTKLPQTRHSPEPVTVRVTPSRRRTTTTTAAAVQLITADTDAKLTVLNLSVPIAKEYKRAVLKTARGNTPIFVYDIGTDMWVSGAIVKSGAWEAGFVTAWQTLLTSVPNATAVDVGANLGQYGLAALVMKRRAVFVEPVLRNAQRIVKSIQAGPAHFKTNGLVLQNALSDSRRRILFRTFKGNVGGTQILDEKFAQHSDKTFGSAFTVVLDDLIGVVPGQDLIMKVDAECSEKQALGKADRFFARYRVHAIMMEWHKCSADTDQTAQFVENMAKRGLKPYQLGAPPKTPLDASKARTGWPGDILWVNERLGVLIPKKT